MMWAIDFEHRSDNGPLLIGPFATKAAGDRYVDGLRDRAMTVTGSWDSAYCVVPLHVPEVR